MFKKYIKPFVLSTMLCFTAFNATSAVITYQGSLGAAQDGTILIDFYSLTLDSLTDVIITVEGSGTGIDIGNGVSDLDTYVIVATDDGDRTADDLIFADDDGGEGFDSFLAVPLAAGDFLIGVSSCCIDADEFITGANTSVLASTYLIPDYILTIDTGSTSVSTPSIFALVSLVVVGFVVRSKRTNA